jgi:radical SAM superfamily enzyme YgiQ (UPF0313 family)
MTRELLYTFMQHITYEKGITYRGIMSRTCHNRCAYCANSALGKLYGKEWRLRRRSVAHFIGELKQAISRFPEIERVVIEDDFFLNNDEVIREFSEAYIREIGLPFVVTGLFPSIITEERMRMLVDAGMYRAGIGIQAGSMRVVRQVYKRPATEEQIINVFQVVEKFKDRFKPVYQYMLDNPWETDEERLETLRQMFLIPKPHILEIFSLTLFPGTALSDRAFKEGLITDERAQVYRKDYHSMKRTYINALFQLFQVQYVPHWVIRLLMSAPLRRLDWIWLPHLADRVFHILLKPRQILAKLKNGMGHLMHGDWLWFRQAILRRTARI